MISLSSPSSRLLVSAAVRRTRTTSSSFNTTRFLRTITTLSKNRLLQQQQQRHGGSGAVAISAEILSSQQQQQQQQQHGGGNKSIAASAAAAALLSLTAITAFATGKKKTNCYSQEPRQFNDDNNNNNNNNDDSHDTEKSPASVGKVKLNDAIMEAEDALEHMPIYTSDEVAINNGDDPNKPIWMTYGGIVYDVTNFISNHPGGSSKIMEAAGSAIEPYWHLYRQHFASELPLKLMESMVIGKLCERDQNDIDEAMDVMIESSHGDPYENEPKLRHSDLIVHSDTPMNAEVPSKLLTENYITPSSLFYIRHHHPVPLLIEDDESDEDSDENEEDEESDDKSDNIDKKYKLQINLKEFNNSTGELSIHELKTKLPKYEIITTLQCSGSRRRDYNSVAQTSGTSWDQGAISTAKWGGCKLRDLLALYGITTDSIESDNDSSSNNIQHVIFVGIDGMQASISIEKALNPYGDCLIAYEMNNEDLPRDHGYPLRAIVPGYVAVRNVKWINKIILSKEEAEGPWQRGLNYKQLPPSVTDAKDVNLDEMPSMTEASIFSGITNIVQCAVDNDTSTNDNNNDSNENSDKADDSKPSDNNNVIHMMKVNGWAWAGGGRNVVRVDVTGDGGKTWTTADITHGKEQKFGRAWAWIFWEATVPAAIAENGQAQISSKAVDMAMNVQPEHCSSSWNVRGLGNNSWYTKVVQVQ